VTVRDWIVERTRDAPQALVTAILAALGDDGAGDVATASGACVAAAARSLDRLVAGQHFGREHAIDLLAIDALATLAFEHEGEVAATDAAIADAATRGARALGLLALARV